MRNKGFTLIELMVVILIVAILAAVLVPIMRGRLDSAKWSEGRSGAGTIATAVRAYCVERGMNLAAAPTFTQLNLLPADLDGKYFSIANYSFTGTFAYTASNGNFDYTINVARPTGISSGGPWTLDEQGTWVENGTTVF